MKWTHNVEQKIKVAGLLAVIFVGIFTVNRLESSRINEMGASMDSVYKDRLVAKNYLFKLSGLLYEKKSRVQKYPAGDDAGQLLEELRVQNQAIDQLIVAYGETNLTPKEQELYLHLQNQVAAIDVQESSIGEWNHSNLSEEMVQLNTAYSAVNTTLSDLSNLQLHIGKSVNDRTQQLLAGSNLLTHFELALLVVVGLLIHALVFASRSVMSTMKIKSHHLN